MEKKKSSLSGLMVFMAGRAAVRRNAGGFWNFMDCIIMIFVGLLQVKGLLQIKWLLRINTSLTIS